MTPPDDKRRNSPTERFRDIMSADANKEEITAARRYPKEANSPGWNLPKPGARDQEQSLVVQKSSGATAPSATVVRGHRFLPAFWTIASIVSLLFNLVLVIAAVGLLRMLGSLNAANLGPGVLGGLYTNFERMDQAHITTQIPVQTIIPLDLTVPVQTTTGVTLTKEVSISGAHMRINTALFNIDAPANITLPAGTSLDVGMNFSIPVQAQIPVSLNVPVDIALQDTDLHPAILGLQDTLRPLYCMMNPSAQSLTGQLVCQ